MDTILRFREAAKALQEDERYLRLQKARTENDDNTELQDMIGEFNLVRLELNDELEKDGRDEEKIASLNERINQLYSGIMQCPSMLAYNEAKQEMKPLMDHINAIITAAVDGEDPMQVNAPADGCGGGCSGCSGCG